MKRLTALVLVLTICLGLCSVTSSAASVGVDAGKQVQTNSYGAETSGEDSDAPINGNLLLGREYTVAFDGATVADDGIKATDGKFRGDGESAWNGDSKGDASVEWMGTFKTITYTFTFDAPVNLNEIVFKAVRVASNRQFGTLIINDNLMFLANEVVKTPVADAPLYVQNPGEEGVDQYFDVSVNIEYYDVTELKIQVITDAYCCQYDEIEAYGTIAEQPVPDPDVSWDETEEPASSEYPSEPDVSWDETEEPAYSEYPSEPDVSWDETEEPAYSEYPSEPDVSWEDSYEDSIEEPFEGETSIGDIVVVRENLVLDKPYTLTTSDGTISYYSSILGDHSNPPTVGETMEIWQGQVTDGVYRAGTEENLVKDAAAGVTLELAGPLREYYYTFGLGAEKSVSSVVLRVAKAYGNRSANIIKVEVSDDGEAWTSVNFLRFVEVVPYSEQGDINYGTTEAPDMRYMMFNILATFNEVNATYVRVSLDTSNPCPDYCYVESAGADRGYILQFDEIEVYGGEEEVLMGDVNGDGSINSLDAAQILRHDAQLLTLEGAGLAAADVNGDGAVNSLDAAMILRLDAGLITEF